MPQIKKTMHPYKKLSARCPYCNSGQVRERKLIGNWKCNSCERTFKKPKVDV